MVGERIKHYEIEKLLGKGGMGMVYLARDVRLDRPVAFKVLKPELTADPHRRRRFLREAKAASAVTHPAIAQIYDVGQEGETIFMAMELVEGRTVRQLITDKELDLSSSVEIALQVSEGLGRAHAKGIVHRDIKSDNIMVTPDGHAKILDFGLAKLLDPGTPQPSEGQDPSQMETVAQTQLGTVMGTIAYMSPEQARGRPVDQTSDVFSLGVVIYEMVTGELPFKGDSPVDTMHAIAYEEVRPVTVVRKNLPPDLHRIVSRCLRKRTEDRFPHAGALAEDLKRLKRDLDSGVQRSVPAAERLREGMEWIKNSTPLGVTGVLIALAGVALVIYLLLSDTSLGGLLVLAAMGLLLYRWFRNRATRMQKRFVSKIRKIPEVKAILVRGGRITVIVDKAEAKIYLRVNSLVDTINAKLFHGEPFEAAVRDDVSPEQLRDVLREPGVVYVREDILAPGT
jgi:serine/threonine protein kinase